MLLPFAMQNIPWEGGDVPITQPSTADADLVGAISLAYLQMIIDSQHRAAAEMPDPMELLQ